MKKLNMYRILLNAMLLLAGINNGGGGTGGDGGNTGGSANNTGNTGGTGDNEEGNGKELKDLILNLQKEVHSYKSQIGHYKSELEKATNNGLTKEEALIKKEKELADKEETLLITNLELHKATVATTANLPKEFLPFVYVTAGRTAESNEESLRKSIDKQVADLNAAIAAHIESVGKGKITKIKTTTSAGTSDLEVSSHVKTVIDDMAQGKNSQVFNPWQTKQ